ncbi:MAG: hypothetical protein WC645_01735 [Candidatus Margulisiibacteriota bacterium]
MGVATFLSLFGCGVPKNEEPAARPVSGEDGGLRDAISDSEVTEAVEDVTGASVGQIFILPALENLLSRGVATKVAFDLPAALIGRNVKISDQFVLHMPSIRIPGNGGRSKMEDVFTVGKNPEIEDISLTLELTPKPKSFDDDRAEGEGDSRYTPWRLVLELDHDGEVIYVVREVRVKGGGSVRPDGGTDGRDGRRDDAGRDVPPPPPVDAGAGDARRPGRSGSV